MNDYYNITVSHIFKAIESPVNPDLLYSYKDEPLTNLKTGKEYNAKEIFRSA